MKIKKSQVFNILIFVFIVLMIIPQTRKPIQIGIHKVFGLFSPSIESEKVTLKNYNWALVNNKGETYNLENTKGKVVFVNLWATWCPPCIAEMPDMQKLYNDYQDKVTFLFVTNESLAKVDAFFKRRRLELPAFQSITNIPAELFSNSIPATYVIGKEGKIHIKKIGAANWNSASVRKLLDELISK